MPLTELGSVLLQSSQSSSGWWSWSSPWFWGFLGVAVVVELVLLNRLEKWAEGYRAKLRQSLPRKSCPTGYQTGQPWRQPTDIRFIEGLKSTLEANETALLDAHIDSIVFPIARAEQSSLWEHFRFWVATHSGGPPTTFSDAEREEYLELISKLDRIWSGNARLEIGDIRVQIQKLERRRQDCSCATDEGKRYARSLDEDIIDLKRDLQDLEEVVERAKTHPHKAKFEDKKSRRRFDVQDEVFEMFERPFEKIVELRLKYNELKERIRKHPQMNQNEKDDLLEELERFYKEHVPDEARESGEGVHKNILPIYKKEA